MILLGFRTDTTSHGNDRNWSLSRNEITEVVTEGTKTEIKDFLKDAKKAISEIGDNYDIITRIEDRKYYMGKLVQLSPVMQKELKRASTRYHFGIKMKNYQRLIMIDGETIQI